VAALFVALGLCGVGALGAAEAFPRPPAHAQDPGAGQPRTTDAAATPGGRPGSGVGAGGGAAPGGGAGPISVPQGAPAIADAARLGEAVAQVAETVSPAVVSIRVEARQERPDAMPFGLFGFGLPPGAVPFGGDAIQRGAGSGVIISPDGAILTNHHVVANATRIEVRLRDGRVLRARVVGSDPPTDLAVLRIDARNLPHARFADVRRARVGEWVVAIGSPFGLDYTVTAGVLSAIGRGGLGMNEIEDYLQTDASINPGNSGGPLVNLRGEVLGINTMIVGRGSGIGFAVPASIARSVSEQLLATGTVRRSWLGVTFQEMTPELAASFGAGERRGALVAGVEPRGPAARAGIRPGDIVLDVDGAPVREGRDLMREVMVKPVGARVRVGLLRQGRPVALDVVTEERPVEPRAVSRGGQGGARGGAGQRGASDPTAVGRPPVGPDAGLGLDTLTPDVARRLGYEGGGRVVVTRLLEGSPAERAGLRAGDVVVEADQREVRAPSDVLQALSDGHALLRVERRQGAFYTVIQRDED
jgi:Do/DeqQ family serine protease